MRAMRMPLTMFLVAWAVPAWGQLPDAKPASTRVSTPVSTHQPATSIDTTTYRNRSVDAYVRALKEKKYTLVLFSKSHHLNAFAQGMEQKLADARLAKYADRVVMCLVDPEIDRDGVALHDAVEVTAYPTLAILKTHSRQIHVVGQIVGECELDVLERVLQETVTKPIPDENSSVAAGP